MHTHTPTHQQQQQNKRKLQLLVINIPQYHWTQFPSKQTQPKRIDANKQTNKQKTKTNHHSTAYKKRNSAIKMCITSEQGLRKKFLSKCTQETRWNSHSNI